MCTLTTTNNLTNNIVDIEPTMLYTKTINDNQREYLMKKLTLLLLITMLTACGNAVINYEYNNAIELCKGNDGFFSASTHGINNDTMRITCKNGKEFNISRYELRQKLLSND